MYFPSLSILTTLACAAFSIAAPLPGPAAQPLNPQPATATDAAIDGVKAEIEGAKLMHASRDDVPPPGATVPSPQDVPLVSVLTDLSNDLQPALKALAKAVDAKVTVTVGTEEIKGSVLEISNILGIYVGRIHQYVGDSVDDVQVKVVATAVGEVVKGVTLALYTVDKAGTLAKENLDPMVATIDAQLAEIVALVLKTVPEALALVVDEVTPIANEIYYLNLASLVQTLKGVQRPA